jgi:Fur family transcriptional regulator, ferric uptake regulator
MTRRRNTRRKQAVVNAVKAVQSPFTAEQLFQMAQQFLPGVSRSTVYRTICILLDEHSIKEIRLPHGKRILAHTDADIRCVVECEDCGRLTSVPTAELSSQLASVARTKSFYPTQSSIYVRGQCQELRGTGDCPLRRHSGLGREPDEGQQGS